MLPYSALLVQAIWSGWHCIVQSIWSGWHCIVQSVWHCWCNLVGLLGTVSAICLVWLALYSAACLALIVQTIWSGWHYIEQSGWSGWHCIVQPAWHCRCMPFGLVGTVSAVWLALYSTVCLALLVQAI